MKEIATTNHTETPMERRARLDIAREAQERFHLLRVESLGGADPMKLDWWVLPAHDQSCAVCGVDNPDWNMVLFHYGRVLGVTCKECRDKYVNRHVLPGKKRKFSEQILCYCGRGNGEWMEPLKDGVADGFATGSGTPVEFTSNE